MYSSPQTDHKAFILPMAGTYFIDASTIGKIIISIV